MRYRRSGTLAGIVVFVAAVSTLFITSVTQNRYVRSQFDTLFTAVQEQDGAEMAGFYSHGTLSRDYTDELFKYELLGWRTTKVSGQPWPMDSQTACTASFEMYFALPDNLVQPKGKYRKITHPQYGPCAVVPVTISFRYDQQERRLMLAQPDLTTGENWYGPFVKAPGGN